MSTTPNQPASKIDDRMALVVEAYYQAIGKGDEALAAELAAAIDSGDIDGGIAIINRKGATR